MPRPSHRLDLCLIVQHTLSESDVHALDALVRSRELLKGGVAAHRVERGEGMRFWANQQGGFRVKCPVTGANLVPVFSAALAEWRKGQERALICPACTAAHDLARLNFFPAAGFGCSALVLCDVESLDWVSADREALEEVLGPFTQVARRIG